MEVPCCEMVVVRSDSNQITFEQKFRVDNLVLYNAENIHNLRNL